MRSLSWMVPLVVVALAGCGDTGGETEADEAATPTPAVEATTPAGDTAPGGELACAPTASGAELTGRASPFDSITVAVGSGRAKVCYSRPSLRGRTMLGGEAVPWGQLWRFGANEPTIIHLNTAARIAGAEVEPGSYSLYAIPAEEGEWTLIVNRSTSQWGHEGQYTSEVQAQEVGRYPVSAEATDETVERFTIRPNPDGSGVIAEWQDSRIHIPIEPRG